MHPCMGSVVGAEDRTKILWKPHMHICEQKSREFSGKREKIISLVGCCKFPLNGIWQLTKLQIANDLKC